MATTSRWPTATGLWLAVPVWAYAVLAALELRGLGYDPTAPPEPDQVAVQDPAPLLVWVTTWALAGVLVLATASLVTGRLRRVVDGLLGGGLLLGGWMLWAVEHPRPVAPWVVAASGVVVALSALGPGPRATGRWPAHLVRLVLVTGAMLAGWVLLHELAGYSWQLRSWTLGYWSGLGLAVTFLLAGLLAPHLAHPVWRWLVGPPLLLLGLLGVVGGVAGLQEGYLVSGHEESEDGWRLGGAALFLGAGLSAAGIAALRSRWVLAAGTIGAAVVLFLALLFGIPEIRRGY